MDALDAEGRAAEAEIVAARKKVREYVVKLVTAHADKFWVKRAPEGAGRSMLAFIADLRMAVSVHDVLELLHAGRVWSNHGVIIVVPRKESDFMDGVVCARLGAMTRCSRDSWWVHYVDDPKHLWDASLRALNGIA